MMKKAIKALALCLLMAFVTSCQTKEEKIVKSFKTLAERVQSQSNSFSDSQWEDIYTQFESLQDQTKECDFSAEQLKEVSAAEAELTAAIAKQKAKELGNDIKDVINEGKEVIEGIFDGLKEGLGDSDEATTE